jgi:hypothetical protein
MFCTAEASFSPRHSNSRRHQFSADLKQEFIGWVLECGIMYGSWEDRTIDNSQPCTGSDANVTSAYNGKYELDGVLAGIGSNFHF